MEVKDSVHSSRRARGRGFHSAKLCTLSVMHESVWAQHVTSRRLQPNIRHYSVHSDVFAFKNRRSVSETARQTRGVNAVFGMIIIFLDKTNNC